MNHKRDKAGFSLHVVLISLVAVAAISLIGWYIVNHRGQTKDVDPGFYQENLVPAPGVINVTFKDGVSFQQAQALVNSLGLSVDNPAQAETDFIPKSYRAIAADQFDSLQSKLRSYPKVASFVDDSADPTNRAGAGQKWVEVIWRQDVTFVRIKQIQIATGLGLSGQPQGINRAIDGLSVPNGQEDALVKKFKHSSIVKDASREMTCAQSNLDCGILQGSAH